MKDTFYIYGKYAVLSALENKPGCVLSIYLTDKHNTDANVNSIIGSAKLKNPKMEVQDFDRNHLPLDLLAEIDAFGTHQNIIARISAGKLVLDGKDFLEKFDSKPNSLFVILGEINDPQNVGAIIRSAGAFGVDAVFIPEHNQAPITGSVIKVSAGAAFTVPLVSIGNINQTIKTLKDKRFWIYGLESADEAALASFENKKIFDESFTEPTAFIIGSEHDGIREKTREHCDLLLSIPITKEVESLNAATSASIAFYEFRRQNKI